jgi:hypothetical protein
MGADIHAHIEVVNTRDKSVEHFAEVDIARDYVLFALLAGVRYTPRETPDSRPVASPKGLPKPVSMTTLLSCTFEVDDELSELEVDGYCSRAEADEWVKKGASEYTDETQTRVTDPDWHSESWLDAKELADVNARYERATNHPHAILAAITAAMQTLEALVGQSRLVFWFKG